MPKLRKKKDNSSGSDEEEYNDFGGKSKGNAKRRVRGKPSGNRKRSKTKKVDENIGNWTSTEDKRIQSLYSTLEGIDSIFEQVRKFYNFSIVVSQLSLFIKLYCYFYTLKDCRRRTDAHW